MSERTVFVVTSGQYSDYHIVAIFSERPLAEAFLDRMPDGPYDHNEIEDYPLDAGIQTGGGLRFPYWVSMYRDGHGAQAEVRGFFDDAFPLQIFRWRPERYFHTSSGSRLQGMVWASDEMHAIKIASERRMQLILSGEWEDEA